MKTFRYSFINVVILSPGGKNFGSHDPQCCNRTCAITRHVITRADCRPPIAIRNIPSHCVMTSLLDSGKTTVYILPELFLRLDEGIALPCEQGSFKPPRLELRSGLKCASSTPGSNTATPLFSSNTLSLSVDVLVIVTRSVAFLKLRIILIKANPNHCLIKVK